MEDLMTGTYNTEELRRDNGGFMVPDFSIEIEGKQIPPFLKKWNTFYRFCLPEIISGCGRFPDI